MAAASPLKLQIEGMDCAACALKIEAAMERLPGVSDINVSYAGGTLALNVDQDRTSQRTIEEKIRALGYQPTGSAPGTQPALPTKRAREPWWQGMKARLVFMTGALFAAAFVASFLLPEWDTWLFAVCGAGQRRALRPPCGRRGAGRLALLHRDADDDRSAWCCRDW